MSNLSRKAGYAPRIKGMPALISLCILNVALLAPTTTAATSQMAAHSISPAQALDHSQRVEPGQAPGSVTPYEMTQAVLPGLMDKAEREGSIRVIVGFDAPIQPEGYLTDDRKQNQRQDVKSRGNQLLGALQGFNFQEKRRFRFVPFITLTVDADTLEYLAALPSVTSIEEDRMSFPAMADSNEIIGSPVAWAAGYEGIGQTVAVLDSGVDKTHPWFSTFGNKVVSEACYSSNSTLTLSMCPGGVPSSTASGSGVNCDVSIDGCDHGTHVAGIAAGDNGVGPGFGVARGADIIAIQVFSRIEHPYFCNPEPAPCITTFDSDVISALERVYELRDEFTIAAANLSILGAQYFDQASCDAAYPAIKAAIDNLRSVNIATVISSGNDGWTDSIAAPGCISSAISVGNTTDFDAIAPSSNIYPYIDLLAPGTSIVSSVPGGGTAEHSGSSMSAAHVTGAWAVLKQQNPGASVSEILAALQSTATLVDDLRTGGIETDMPRINLTGKKPSSDEIIFSNTFED